MTSVHPWDDVRIFHKECRSLAEVGFDVHLVARGAPSFSRFDVTVHGVPVASGGRLGRMLGTAWRVYRYGKKLDADIYHFHDPELLPYGLLLKWSGKRVVYDAHEDVPRDILSKPWIAAWLRAAIAGAFETFEDCAARRLTAVVAATPHIAYRFRQQNPRAVDINNYPMASELEDSVEAASSGRRVCYVGGISRIRGAVQMVQALDDIDATLVLAGKMESPDLEAELRALPGWKKVDYRGLVSRDQVREIFAASRAGLLFFHPEPNHLDAQPNKMFEYMSAGLPVLASDFPLWRQLLDGVGAGICVDPLAPKSIAQAISGILDYPEQGDEMGRAGKRAVTDIYRWEREAEKLVNLYRAV